MNQDFELWFGCLGNGITVCNSAKEHNGNYERIAHISVGGNIRLYVEESYIPKEDMERLKSTARKTKENFRQKFEQLPDAKQYAQILDALPLREFLDALSDKSPLSVRLPKLKEQFYAII